MILHRRRMTRAPRAMARPGCWCTFELLVHACDVEATPTDRAKRPRQHPRYAPRRGGTLEEAVGWAKNVRPRGTTSRTGTIQGLDVERDVAAHAQHAPTQPRRLAQLPAARQARI